MAAETTWDFIYKPSCRWPVFSSRLNRQASSASPLWFTSEFSTPLPAVLTHATFLLTFAGPTSLLYATTQMSALFPMMNESPFSAHLSCLPVVCPCWRNNLPFPVLRRPKGAPEVTGKEMAAVGKFRYLIKSTDKGAARWTEDISAKAQDGIWKSGSIVGLLKYCYCTAMQWSSEDNQCTRVHAHTRTHAYTHKPHWSLEGVRNILFGRFFFLDLRSKGESPDLEVTEPSHSCAFISPLHLFIWVNYLGGCQSWGGQPHICSK